jgi:hypothetical protein
MVPNLGGAIRMLGWMAFIGAISLAAWVIFGIVEVVRYLSA